MIFRSWLSFYFRWKGFYGVLLCFIHQIKQFLIPKNERFIVHDDHEGKLFLRSKTSDLRTFRTVVVQDEFQFPEKAQDYLKTRYEEVLAEGKLPVVIDGGANIGLTARIFANMFPEAQIIAVEPDGLNYDLAKINCSRYLNIEPIQAAVWHCSEAVEVINPASDEWSYQFQSSNNNRQLDYIPGVTIDEILCDIQSGVLFLLKLDIEGAESLVLHDDGKWWGSAPALLVEPHDYREGVSNSIGGVMTQAIYQTGNIHICGESLMFLPKT